MTPSPGTRITFRIVTLILPTTSRRIEQPGSTELEWDRRFRGVEFEPKTAFRCQNATTRYLWLEIL